MAEWDSPTWPPASRLAARPVAEQFANAAKAIVESTRTDDFDELHKATKEFVEQKQWIPKQGTVAEAAIRVTSVVNSPARFHDLAETAAFINAFASELRDVFETPPGTDLPPMLAHAKDHCFLYAGTTLCFLMADNESGTALRSRSVQPPATVRAAADLQRRAAVFDPTIVNILSGSSAAGRRTWRSQQRFPVMLKQEISSFCI